MNPALRPGCARPPVRTSPRSLGRLPRPSAAAALAGGARQRSSVADGARTLGGFPVPVRGLRALAERCADDGVLERATAVWGTP
jgi:hypothetical protein